MATPWSFQLYSARNFLPWDKILKMVAQVGYSRVEGFGGVYADAVAFRKELDANGLTMPSGHFAMDLLENDFDGAAKIAKTLGVQQIICPHIAADARPADAAGWQAFGKRLGKVGDDARKAGFEFGWHNHDFEFKTLPDNSLPQKLIFDAAPSISWEADIAWIIRSGGDPLQWIENYGSRISAVHVKDIAAPGQNTNEDGWADVGYGTVDWRALTAALRETPVQYFIMEHDNPSDDERFARRSIATVKTF
jgi:sugar phosphate isomerase/epimerase